jgi:hypothetical protein
VHWQGKSQDSGYQVLKVSIWPRNVYAVSYNKSARNFINFCSYAKCQPRASNSIPFQTPSASVYDTFLTDLQTFTQITPQKEMVVQFLRNGIKLAEIVLRLVLLVTVLKLALRFLLGQQGAFYICGLKMRGNKTNVR